MEKSLVDKDLGDKGELKLDLVNGDLKFTVSYAVTGVTGGVSITVSADELLDKLKAVIPGEIDDAVIDIVKAALKS